MRLASRHSRRQVLMWLAASPVLLAGCDRGAGSRANGSFRGLEITGTSHGRGFSLTDHTGRVRTLADFRDQVVMLYFGFVQCPDVCPTALTRAAAVKQLLGDQASRLQVLFVTVDPERDTPDMLREYMAAFDPGFLTLTGSAADISAVADEFKVFYKQPLRGGQTVPLTLVFEDERGRRFEHSLAAPVTALGAGNTATRPTAASAARP